MLLIVLFISNNHNSISDTMKTVTILLLILLVFGKQQSLNAQTSGTLRFSCLTNAPSGTWGNKHVAAIWIQNNADPSVFIKTNAKYGHEDDHLTSWIAVSGKSLVDAVTGATLSTYDTLNIEWNGTDVSQEVVADGNYTIYIEMGWGKDKVAQHATTGFTFTKSGTAETLIPEGDSNYSAVNISWQPTATLVGTLEARKGISVFPNPSKGEVRLNFQKELQNVDLTVSDLTGKTIWLEHQNSIPAGLKAIDLTGLPTGMYLLGVKNETEYFSYKVIIEK